MSTPRSILVLRFSSLGDIVLATSVTATLCRLYPDSRIDFLTLEEYASLLENHAVIDRVLAFPRQEGTSGLRALGLRLRSFDYDLVIDLHNTLRAKLIRKYLRSIPTYVFNKPRWHRFLLYYFHRNRFPAGFNQVHAMHEVIKPVNTKDVFSLPALKVSEEEKQAALIKFLPNRSGQDYICLIPGAAWPQKQWLAENYARLAQAIDDQYQISTVLLGTLDDVICGEIVKFYSTIINLQAATTLRESLSIIANSKLVLGSDTGLTHAAEALNVPAVMLMGPTSVETGGGTNRPESVTLGEELYCRPCSQNGSRPCHRKQQYCMTNMSVDKVKAAVVSVLGK